MIDSNLTRRSLLRGLLAGGCSVLAGCNWDGHLNFLGYTTRPNYDENFKTIYLPIFKNKAFQTTPNRGIEFALTRAVINELETVARLKVVDNPNEADTELLGTIVQIDKVLLNRSQLNEVREGDVLIGVQLVWRDLRSGQVLSNPRKPVGVLPATELPPFDPANPPPQVGPEDPIPTLLIATGRYLPEVGETNATAQQRACNSLAKKVAQMMEKDWQLPPKPCP